MTPDPSEWREQYDRMCRWRDRLIAAPRARIERVSTSPLVFPGA
jgi:hypothetical protein